MKQIYGSTAKEQFQKKFCMTLDSPPDWRVNTTCDGKYKRKTSLQNRRTC